MQRMEDGMAALTPEQVEFLRHNRYAIVAAIRRDGTPQQTLVIYALDGDDTVIFSSGGDRVKLKLLRRDPRISLCVINEEPHIRYLTVSGRAEFVEDHASVVESMLKIHTQLRGEPLPAAERPAFAERARREGRVIVRVKIEDALPWRPPRSDVNISERRSG
jgi:PPOX class probable F420-dependent enzyme